MIMMIMIMMVVGVVMVMTNDEDTNVVHDKFGITPVSQENIIGKATNGI